MILDYARYYLTFGLQLLTAYGVVRGGHLAWLGLSTLFILAAADAILPDDLAERRLTNPTLANIPVWLCTVSGPALVLLLAWSIGQGHLTGTSLAGAIISVAWMSVIAFVPPSHELYHQRRWLAGLASRPQPRPKPSLGLTDRASRVVPRQRPED